VKSAQQMVVTAEDFRVAGIDAPLLVGGAALTRKFTMNKISAKYGGPVLYAKDAMEGLDIANRLLNPEEKILLLEEVEQLKVEMSLREVPAAPADGVMSAPRVSNISREAPVLLPPDTTRHVLRNYPLAHIRPYLNLQMLIGKHLGLPGNVPRLLDAGDAKAHELLDMVEELIHLGEVEGLLRTDAVYQFFPAQAEGNDILIFNPQDLSQILQRLPFPRQGKDPYLCLADFIRPVSSGVMDYVAMFAVTAGSGVRQRAEEMKQNGDYLRSHALQALALELAEAFAERLHHILRDSWGFPDAPELSMRERFIARYQGIRVSFGYPACPDLENQAPLFQLLRPEDIGMELTDGFMMDPEASVSALVFSHPEAKYFNVEV
jgi:5-methyltetrahydrofolate--homocysteine methyltransferase